MHFVTFASSYVIIIIIFILTTIAPETFSSTLTWLQLQYSS